MECNRDEAVRAKTIAEKKLMDKDFSGSKKFVLKALSLYPELEGLPQLSTTLDVYISAENKISGEVDWYGILGVNPLADDETVKKQYRKLALMLHPDKNKSVGAEGAFKLISEAWGLLSDKTKRLAYNQRRSVKGLHQSVAAQSRGPSAPPRPPPPKAPPGANGFHYFPKNATANARTQNNSARASQTAIPPATRQRTDTFWTICQRCKMHYEYLKTYLNHTLLCPNCHQAFMASEMAPPFSFQKSSNLNSSQRHQNSSHPVSNASQNVPVSNAAAAHKSGPGGSSGVSSFDRTHVHHNLFPRTAGVGSTISSPSTSTKAAAVVQQANEKLKRRHEETHTAFGWENRHVSSSGLQGDSFTKKRRVDDSNNGYGSNMANQMSMGYGRAAHVFSGISQKPNSIRELSLLELRNMLMEKARKEIRKKLKEWSSETTAKAAEKGKKKATESDKVRKGVAKVDINDSNGHREASGTKMENEIPSTPAIAVAEDKEVAPVTIAVPDPDFHDFDLDRSENCFGENQVWAAYDDDDGMPRFYAMIHKVIALKPFKMKISWLNSKTTSEFGPMQWLGSGFAKTCGDFRIGKHELNKSLNSFSHKVKWTKGTRGAVCIYPKKGDAWALFRNWSPDWNEHTPDEVIHKYDMVEVLDDYNEDQGVSVTPLVKVAGFRTVFKSHPDPQKVTRIPKEEMFRFSHQVPNYVLTGQEAPNAPKGCLELDPAAAPLELLQVITEANDVLSPKPDPEVKGGISPSTEEIKKDEIVNDDVKGEKEVVC